MSRTGRAARPAARRAASPARGAHARGDLLAALAAGAAALLVHLPSLANGFARDDHELVPAIARWSRGLPALLTADFWAPAGAGSGLWRPLVTLSLGLDARLGGGAPLPFHAVNVALAALAAALVCLVIAHAGVPRLAALAGALWFATLPAHAEAVAWVVGRTDVLSAALALAAFGLDRRARAAGRAWPGVAALLVGALALLAKETALALPVVVVAAEWTRDRASAPSPRALARWLAPWAALALAWLALHAVCAEPGGLPVYVDLGAVARWPATAWTLLPHAAAFLWPWYAHTPDAAPLAVSGALDPRVIVGALLTLATLALAGVLAARRSRALAPLALAVAPLLPTIALALAGRALAFGERLVYLPSAGAAWLLALAVERALRSPRARGPVLAAVVTLVVAGAAVSVPLQAAWRDDGALYARMRVAQPGNPVGLIGVADGLAQAGRRAEAEALLAAAARLDPRAPALHLVRAALHYRYGEWADVLASADSALALAPGDADARLLAATALLRLRRLDEAGAALARLERERPGDPAVRSLAGQAALLAGEPATAERALDEATALGAADPATWYALGVARALDGRPADAARAFERTVTLDPAYYDGWLELARARAASGDGAGARDAFARAAALPEARDGRAAALGARLARGAPAAP